MAFILPTQGFVPEGGTIGVIVVGSDGAFLKLNDARGSSFEFVEYDGSGCVAVFKAAENIGATTGDVRLVLESGETLGSQSYFVGEHPNLNNVGGFRQTLFYIPPEGGSVGFQADCGVSALSSGASIGGLSVVGDGGTYGILLLGANPESSPRYTDFYVITKDHTLVPCFVVQGATDGASSGGGDTSGSPGEIEPWVGEIPSGNTPSGGAEERPTLSDSGSRIWWRGAGADDVIRAETDVSGGVNSEGGESWRITLKMRRERAVKFVKTSALFVGSVWQPVPLPSRNKPAICGWDVSYQGQIATVEIRYEIVAGTSYNYSTPEAPVESRHDAVSHAVTERPLSECKAIFGESKPEDNAIIVEWCKKYIQAIDPTLSADERKTATDNFFAALLDGAKKTKDEFLNSSAAKAVLTCLRSGQDSFLAYTATVARTEILNTKPDGVGNGVGKYGTPASPLVSGGRWLLVSDDLKQTSSGQYERARTWQKAEIESEAYE